jgi:hypothetical protein
LALEALTLASLALKVHLPIRLARQAIRVATLVHQENTQQAIFLFVLTALLVTTVQVTVLEKSALFTHLTHIEELLKVCFVCRVQQALEQTQLGLPFQQIVAQNLRPFLSAQASLSLASHIRPFLLVERRISLVMFKQLFLLQSTLTRTLFP